MYVVPGLPEDTKEKVQEWVEGEEEKAERQKEGEQVLKEVAAPIRDLMGG